MAELQEGGVGTYGHSGVHREGGRLTKDDLLDLDGDDRDQLSNSVMKSIAEDDTAFLKDFEAEKAAREIAEREALSEALDAFKRAQRELEKKAMEAAAAAVAADVGIDVGATAPNTSLSPGMKTAAEKDQELAREVELFERKRKECTEKILETITITAVKKKKRSSKSSQPSDSPNLKPPDTSNTSIAADHDSDGGEVKGLVDY
eukprot:comp8461_c0_seq1/m.9236 comp8461_c0_seq1/g.9236  ORF comp8461_c0_seq1/g.9236 comp8461_c0_seq1/m.9236 type:complete len:204 (-) comp8461_c0_seq1:27-638(-)